MMQLQVYIFHLCDIHKQHDELGKKCSMNGVVDDQKEPLISIVKVHLIVDYTR